MLQFEVLTDIGKKRTVNEDSAAVYTHPRRNYACRYCRWNGWPRGGILQVRLLSKLLGNNS